MGIKFEYTSPGSTQQNRKCEHKFATLYGKVCSKLNGAHLTPNMCHGLWTECAACATMEENILLSDKSPVPPYKLFFGVDAPLSKNLRMFGEIRIIANLQKKIKAKLDNRGSPCIFVGYSTSNEIDVFRFYGTTTKNICLGRNVTWLDRNYGTWKSLNTNIIKLEEDDIDDPGEFVRDDKDDEKFKIQPDVQPIIVEEKPAVCAALSKLQMFPNDTPAATTTPRSLRSGREFKQTQEGKKKKLYQCQIYYLKILHY